MFELDETATVHANILSGAQQGLDLIQEYETAPPDSARRGILPDQIGTSTAGISSTGSKA